MARIPEAEIARLKAQVSLLDLVGRQGYQPRKHGKDYAIRCPFHEDETPSLILTPGKNLFHCFGCGAAGTVLDWVMLREGCTFRVAYAWLCRDAGVEPQVEPETPPVAVSECERQALLERVVADYQQTLKDSKRGLAYLEQRGLAQAEALAHFRLGYSDRSLSKRLPSRQSNAGADLRAKLNTVGIFRASGHEHFAGSLVIPVINPEGVITDLYGRKILDSLRAGTPLHTYLPGPHRGVWNLEGLTEPDVILCESLIDALTFWIHGFPCVTASYGTHGFTEAHLQAFTQRGIRRVLLAYWFR